MKLTLRNLVPSTEDKVHLLSLSKLQRKALYNLCEILHLTTYEPEMRGAAKALQEIIRKNTLGQMNECEFDKTLPKKAMEKSQKYLKQFWHGLRK
jgi:hypothetical protein